MTKKCKKVLAAAVAAVVSFLYGPAVRAQAYETIDERAARNVVTENKLRRQVEFLSDSLCAGRASGTRGACEAAFYITGIFRDAEITPFGDSYSMSFKTADGRTGRNIAGILPGSKKNPPDSYIIVGAHYDHIGVLGGRLYPGADSNASGVAAMTAVAEMFSSMKTLGRVYRTSIIFVAFDARELSLAGSEDFWKRIESGMLKDPFSGKTVTKDKIKMMINIDQIGSSLSPLSSGREDFMIVLGGRTIPKDDMEWLHICNKFYGTALELSESYYGSENFTRLFYTLSDQKVFVEHKIPALLFTSGITLDTNKTHDTSGRLNYPVFRRRILLIYHWLDKMMRY